MGALLAEDHTVAVLPPRGSGRARQRAQFALELAQRGFSNKQIAMELGVAQSTVSRITRVLPIPTLEQAMSTLADVEELSRGERAVLALAASGASTDDIAAQRGTSPRTIANQLRNAYEKLGISSRRTLRVFIAAQRERNK